METPPEVLEINTRMNIPIMRSFHAQLTKGA
jgi:hypothetical protein